MVKKPVFNQHTLPLFWMIGLVAIVGVIGVIFGSSSFERGNLYGQASTMPCQDSDGDDPFTRGLVIDRTSYYDECLDDAIVKEMVCRNGEVHVIPVACSNSCVDGACR